MRYRKLSPMGDYTFGNGLQDFYIDVPAAPGQAVKTRLLLWLGEWFLDNTVGTPYLEGILGKHSQTMADTTVQDRTLGTQGVTAISSFQSTIDPVDRSYSVQMTIDTQYGTTPVQVQNFVNF